MTKELVCPNCHVSLDERQLVTNSWSVESCPHCRAMVRKQEGFRWQKRDALVLEDVTAIGTWLDSIARADPLLVVRRADEEAKGKYVWEVDEVGTGGNLWPWTCTVEYSSDTPTIFAVRLPFSLHSSPGTEKAMSLTEIVVEGTLKPDGTLELDQKPSLSPGRVTVVLRQESEPTPPKEGWWQFMQRARRELEASRGKFMNEEEVNAHIEWLREGDRIDDLLRQAAEERQEPEQP